MPVPLPTADAAAPRALLLALLAERAYRHGSFTLASGRVSHHYVNCKPVSLAGNGLALLGAQLLELVEPEAIAVAGLTLGADPLVSAVAMRAALDGRPLDALIVRKQVKGHGTGSALEGPLPPAGSRVTVLEDVVTSGGSALVAVKRLREAGYRVERVAAIVDRQEGGADALAAEGLELRSLFLLEEVAATAAGANPWRWSPEGASRIDEDVALLRLEGADSLRFLHGQTSQAIEAAQPGAWLRTCCITPTGRMMAVAEVLVDGQGAWLVLPAPGAEAVRQSLDRVLFPADRVSLGLLRSARLVTPLNGAAAASAAAPSARERSWRSRQDGGEGWWLGERLLLPEGAALPEGLAALPPLAPAAAERLRIQRGEPAAPGEIQGGTNPFELGLADRVSLTKGCYVGQETLAKLATYDGVKQQLRRWHLPFAAMAGGPDPLVGTALLTREGERAGTITTALRVEEGWIGLALVRRAALDAPRLRYGEGAAGMELILSMPEDFVAPPVGAAGAGSAPSP